MRMCRIHFILFAHGEKNARAWQSTGDDGRENSTHTYGTAGDAVRAENAIVFCMVPKNRQELRVKMSFYRCKAI